MDGEVRGGPQNFLLVYMLCSIVLSHKAACDVLHYSTYLIFHFKLHVFPFILNSYKIRISKKSVEKIRFD